MRVMAQMGMVMNLDKCIGCHTCSVTCKQAWTNRAGTEYVWFNNVETRPGQGYPRRYEDQETWKGGWELNRRGNLRLKAGGRVNKLLGIFASPFSPSSRTTTSRGPTTTRRSSRRRSATTSRWPGRSPSSPARTPRSPGRPTGTTTSAAQRDGAPRPHRREGPPRVRGQGPVRARADLHVLPAADLRALPQPVVHGVLPLRARSTSAARTASSSSTRTGAAAGGSASPGCPYKKIYFNHKTGKAEKCTFCYPRVEVGLPTVCSETCVGRLRYLGLFLYDADRVTAAAATPTTPATSTRRSSTSCSTPTTPRWSRRPAGDGIPEDWLDAARRSPVYALAKTYRVALPLHPEYRTMPMVWYVPPLSPVVDLLAAQGHDAEDRRPCSARSTRCGSPSSTSPSSSPPGAPTS